MNWQTEFDEEFGIIGQITSNLDLDDYHQYLHQDIKAFIQDLLDRKAERIEASKKEKLYHWRNFGDIDGSNEYSEGIVENHKDAPDVADGSSCDFVWNSALNQAISILKEE